MSDLTARTEQFFATWSSSFDGMCDGYRATFASDCEWDQRPMYRTRDLDGALRFLRLARRGLGLETVDVEVLSLAVVADVVHTARVDHLRRRDGSLIGSAPVAGVLTFSGGQLVHWKEYFDPTVFSARIAGSSVRHLAGRVRR